MLGRWACPMPFTFTFHLINTNATTLIFPYSIRALENPQHNSTKKDLSLWHRAFFVCLMIFYLLRFLCKRLLGTDNTQSAYYNYCGFSLFNNRVLKKKEMETCTYEEKYFPQQLRYRSELLKDIFPSGYQLQRPRNPKVHISIEALRKISQNNRSLVEWTKGYKAEDYNDQGVDSIKCSTENSPSAFVSFSDSASLSFPSRSRPTSSLRLKSIDSFSEDFFLISANSIELDQRSAASTNLKLDKMKQSSSPVLLSSLETNRDRKFVLKPIHISKVVPFSTKIKALGMPAKVTEVPLISSSLIDTISKSFLVVDLHNAEGVVYSEQGEEPPPIRSFYIALRTPLKELRSIIADVARAKNNLNSFSSFVSAEDVIQFGIYVFHQTQHAWRRIRNSRDWSDVKRSAIASSDPLKIMFSVRGFDHQWSSTSIGSSESFVDSVDSQNEPSSTSCKSFADMVRNGMISSNVNHLAMFHHPSHMSEHSRDARYRIALQQSVKSLIKETQKITIRVESASSTMNTATFFLDESAIRLDSGPPPQLPNLRPHRHKASTKAEKRLTFAQLSSGVVLRTASTKKYATHSTTLNSNIVPSKQEDLARTLESRLLRTKW